MWRAARQARFPKVQYGGRMRNKMQELRKERVRGPTPLQGGGAKTESKSALLYFQSWMKEQAGSKAITHVAFRTKEQSDH